MTLDERALNDTKVVAALTPALNTIRRTIPKIGRGQPRIGRPALTYELCQGSDWVEGVWIGQLWLVYAESRDKVFREAAHEQKHYFYERINYPATHDHDLGFLYSLSLVADYKLTNNQESRRVALQAAESLARRFNPAGQFIRAWNVWHDDTPEVARKKPGKIIIDCLENLGLLYWAAQESGQAHFYEIAVAHATTAARYLVRPDSSTFHTYDFDPVSGQPIGSATWQGYQDSSSWSRGQGWGRDTRFCAFLCLHRPALFQGNCDPAGRLRDCTSAGKRFALLGLRAGCGSEPFIYVLAVSLSSYQDVAVKIWC